MPTSLQRIQVEGFRSLENLDLSLGPLNVLIGSNGAGKSNLLQLLRMFEFMASGSLQHFVGVELGGASSLLTFGPKRTPAMTARLTIKPAALPYEDHYNVRLAHGAGDVLLFVEETLERVGASTTTKPLGAGHREALLLEDAKEGGGLPRDVLWFVQRMKGFHFHDTSQAAGIRNSAPLSSGAYLRGRGENLAAYLRRLREERRPYYDRIVATVRRVAPFFKDFELDVPSGARDVMLRWRAVDQHYEFGPHQLSDGTLRFMGLATALLRPEDEMPRVLVLDEPELGLHPYATTILGGLLRAASKTCQVIVATQSPLLLDQVDPADVVVVDQGAGLTSAQRLDPEALRTWLEAYSLSELWEKNRFGGVPR